MAALEDDASVPDKDSEAPPDERGPPGRHAPRGRARSLADLDSLDLHGASIAEALERLEAFVASAAARDRRRVLVITGRGRRSSGGVPVLRRAVLSWLRREGRRWVREAEVAPEGLGGEGALVARLWRPRPR